jgi:hypothetical protein
LIIKEYYFIQSYSEGEWKYHTPKTYLSKQQADDILEWWNSNLPEVEVRIIKVTEEVI